MTRHDRLTQRICTLAFWTHYAPNNGAGTGSNAWRPRDGGVAGGVLYVAGWSLLERHAIGPAPRPGWVFADDFEGAP